MMPPYISVVKKKVLASCHIKNLRYERPVFTFIIFDH